MRARSRIQCVFLFSVAFILSCLPTIAQPQENSLLPAEGEQTFFQADEISYDEASATTHAWGNVEIVYGERLLRADRISYNERTGLITASGQVALADPSGTVIFARRLQLSNELDSGMIEAIRMKLDQESRIVARRGTKNGPITTMEKTVYSPCSICADQPNPIWQVKAERIVHDDRKKSVKYRHAYLQLFDVPVLYTPYFKHPDPRVKKMSGFLVPTYEFSNTGGFMIDTPYFWNIREDFDLTLAPRFYSQKGTIMRGEMRKLFSFANVNVKGSALVLKQGSSSARHNHVRGHIDLTSDIHMNNHWRAHFDVKRVSDSSYGSQFGQSVPERLPAQATLEGFYDQSFTQIETQTWQGTGGNDHRRETPFIFPDANFEYISSPDSWGGRIGLRLNALKLRRTEGSGIQRLTGIGYWHAPFLLNHGIVGEFEARMQTDFANGRKRPAERDRPHQETTHYRLFPQAKAALRYPLIRTMAASSQYIEPKIAFIAAPDGMNPSKRPNEDSLRPEIDEVGLFAPSRLPGLDYVDSGSRIAYGLGVGHVGTVGKAHAFLGQAFHFTQATELPKESGMYHRFSDFVGAFDLQPFEIINIFYRLRLDRRSFDDKRHEVNLNTNLGRLNTNARYVFVNKNAVADLNENREEIRLGLGFELTEYWKANSSLVRDLNANEARSYGLSMSYEDECFIFSIGLSRSFYRDVHRDIKPRDSVGLRLHFKTLGGFDTAL